MLHLTDDLLCAAHGLSGNIRSGILNSVTTVVLTAPLTLCRIPELPAQTLGTVIQSTPDHFFWNCR